jgi:hypothetical protein
LLEGWTSSLLEVISGPSSGEATFVVFSRYRGWLRKRRRIFEVLNPEAEVFHVRITPEDMLDGRERMVAFREFIARGRKRLKDHRLRFWLEGILTDLDTHGKLNLARVARKLGKNRSSAVRAFNSIAHAVIAQRAEEDAELF